MIFDDLVAEYGWDPTRFRQPKATPPQARRGRKRSRRIQGQLTTPDTPDS